MASSLHLHLLRRVSSLEIPRASSAFAAAAINALFHNHPSPLLLPPTPDARIKGTQVTRRPPFPHHPEKHLKAFCAAAKDAMDTEGGGVSSSYLSVRIPCPKAYADVLSEALLCFGASSASMDEESTCEDADEICITSIFTDGDDVRSCVLHASNSVGLKCMPDYKVSKGEECDWLKNAQENFHPTEVTSGLWIVPKWTTPPDLEATNIFLNPGLAFGTGEHPTTKLCLLLLKHLIQGGECFLDYGTGSGILGIAAVKMGATLSVGLDIDPQAVASARQNMTLNEIGSDRMAVYLVPNNIHLLSPHGSLNGDKEKQASYNLELDNKRGRFDIIIANILINPLIELMEHIVAFGKAGAVIGVSGILSEQVQEVKECYSEHLDDITVSEMDGWASLHGIKKREQLGFPQEESYMLQLKSKD